MIKNKFFVFDLDDTLYFEADFLESGIQAVSRTVLSTYKIDCEKFLLDLATQRHEDLWGALCQKLKIPESCKNSFLWIYRLHSPSIKLSLSTIKLINILKEESAGIAILTDGRSITQRAKLNSLGLSDIPAYISEEFSSEKPHPLRYEIIQSRHLADIYTYIGDNPAKDFLAPNEMGWETIGLKGTHRNIHSQNTDSLDKKYLPHKWVSSLEQIVAEI